MKRVESSSSTALEALLIDKTSVDRIQGYEKGEV